MVGRPSSQGLGSSYRRLGGRGAVCKAMLRSWEAGQSKKRRGDPRDRLAWSTCPAMRFSEVFPHPTTGPALPSPTARLRPPQKVGAQVPVLTSVEGNLQCTRKHWRSCWACKFGHMWSSPSYSTPWPIAKLFSLET